MTIADSNSLARSSPLDHQIHLDNLETLLLKVDSLDDVVIDVSNKFSKKPEPGMWSWITSYWEEDQTEKINASILELLVELNKNRENFTKVSSGRTILDSEIKELILKKLLNAGEKYFDPLSLWRLKNIQDILAQNLKELREFKRNAIQEILSRDDVPEFDEDSPSYNEKKALKKAKQIFYEEKPTYKMDVSVAKAELMYDLKIGTGINSKGATGSVIVSWFNKKKIAIFKPEDKEQFLSEAIINQVKYWIGGQISHFKRAYDAQPKAEVAAHLVAKYFGIDITCQTKLVKLGQSEGSFQLWAQGMDEIQDIYHLLETQPEYHPKEIFLFQVMAILDFLLGNLDCHGGNCLIRSGKGGILINELRKIDCANTFITHNTKRKMITDSKQYIWSSLKIAKVEFSDEAKEIMAKLTEDAITEVIEIITQALPCYLNEDIITHFRQRANVLLAVSEMEHYTPCELGQLQTDEELNGFLQRSATSAEPIKVTRSDEEFEIIDDYDGIEFKKTSDDSDHE